MLNINLPRQEHCNLDVVTRVGSGINRSSRAMPTRPYRILSRNLYQRLGARAAWDRAIEIIRKSELRRVDAQALMRTQRNARDEHLAEIKACLGGYRDLGDVELIPDLDCLVRVRRAISMSACLVIDSIFLSSSRTNSTFPGSRKRSRSALSSATCSSRALLSARIST